MSADALLAIDGLGVRFGGIVAVHDVAFDVHEGELLGLLGPNGAGKTTLLRLISGVVAPTAGQIRFRGESLNRLNAAMRAQRGIALSHQIVRPFRNMTLLENVVFAAGSRITRTPWRALATLDRRSLRDEAMRCLELVGIGAQADRLPGAQPLGVLKRLEVARALATQPRLLLLDEPLAGLGHGEALRLADLIRQLNDRADRTQPGRGDAHLPAHRGAEQRPQDGRRTRGRGHARPGRHRSLPGRRSRAC